MKSQMQHLFSRVPEAEIERSSFNRSHGYKTTFDAGFLVPIFLDEVLPGDTFNLKASMFARLSTPIKPIMDNIIMDDFWFFVPNRLLWDNWQRMNGEQDDPGDSVDFRVPKIDIDSVTAGDLADYFGLPQTSQPMSVNALPFRAYSLIYKEWFRDQNLQNSPIINKGNGPDDIADYDLFRRGKRHDYFTSCLPFPQKGPDVTLPLGTRAPVTGIGVFGTGWAAGPTPGFQTGGTGVIGVTNYQDSWSPGSAPGNVWVKEDPNNAGFPGIFADLNNATAATINTIRQAFQLQRLYERDARGGTRYTEILKAHFGVTSPDARLQRPEYLGGGSTPVNIHPIAQTSVTANDLSSNPSPQGNLAAFGTVSTSGGNHGFTKSFVEHGWIIGLVSVRADLNYQQGINRFWSRQTRFDHYWPALAHLGEQAVLNKEIFYQNLPADDAVFGYQERYAEYRYKPSVITGQFSSNYAQSLDFWHLAQDFGALPVLGDTFIKETPPMSRVLAVTDSPHFLFDSYFDLTCARPMPVFGVPGMMDHF